MKSTTYCYYGRKFHIESIKKFYLKKEEVTDKEIKRALTKYMNEKNFEDLEIHIYEDLYPFEQSKYSTYILTMKNIPKRKTIQSMQDYMNTTNIDNFTKVFIDIENILTAPQFGSITIEE